MYKQISIKNLKTFEDEQKLKIAPITLLYGENSSGKTTLLKSLDILHNVFMQRPYSLMSPLRIRSTPGEVLRRGLMEDSKNISARKLHFFSSKINKKPIEIEVILNLPYRKIKKDHILFSSDITEDYEYFEESVESFSGKPKKTLSRKTIGTSTYVIDKMPNGSIRKMVIRDTGEKEGKETKYQVSILGSSKIFKSKEKIKRVPVKFFIELKYYPGIKLTKIKKIGVKNSSNKTLITFSRIARQYNFIKDKNKFGYIRPAAKENLKRNLKENPDFFTSSAGYADYKIEIPKDNQIWEKAYKKYEKIFLEDKNIIERLNKTRLLFRTLNKFKHCKFFTVLKGSEVEISWENFSELVTSYILSNNNTNYMEMEKTLNSFFQPGDEYYPKTFNSKKFEQILYEQTEKEIFDNGEIGWEGFEREDYFSTKILFNHSNARKFGEKIWIFSVDLQSAFHSDFYALENLLKKKVSFKKFCAECKNSYKDYYIRFRRLPYITGLGGNAEIRHNFINNFGETQRSNMDIFFSFINFIYRDVANIFKDYKIYGSKFSKSEVMVKRSTPHFILNNCLKEITKNVNGFIPCHPNKTENSYDVPMEEEFHLEEIEKAIGNIYDPKYIKGKKIKEYLKKIGIGYKEIIVEASEYEGIKKIEKLYKDYKIERDYNFPELHYRADFLVTDKKNKKTVIETRAILSKKNKMEDFLSLPESINANGENFDEVICNNNKLRIELNKILKPLLNLKIIVVTPEWLKNISEDALKKLRRGWDRGSFRSLWPLRKRWPSKKKFIMLQDLSYNKFFNIHGREVGKGPSNILPFLAQILSEQPNITYLIQELENNWHPKNQSRIIKAIVDVMKKSKKKNFILETHSELFILQIQKLVEKGILKKEDVSINYISRTRKGNSEIHNIPLNSQGGFEKPWPGGFFNERMEVLTS